MPESHAASFVNTAGLATARSSHTATLLANGKVLVAGGYFSGSPFYLSSVEVYDPATGSWSPTTSLNTARMDQAAPLLQNGKVLVVAGASGSGELTSAELYDPVAGTWTYTGALTNKRRRPSATLLPNGKVLVVGGSTYDIFGTHYLNSCELYDPATGTWTVTGSLQLGREYHTATLLPNGKVLVAGGLSATAACELYDPANGTWSPTGSLNTGRGVHVAVLLPNGFVLAAGGYGGDTSAELYNPATGVWTPTGSMAARRWNPSVTLLPNGKTLVAGGYYNGTGTPTYFATTELYDPTTGAWTTSSNMNTACYSQTATLLANGRVLLAGGANTIASLTNAQLYESAAANWTPTGSLNAADSSRNAATLLPNGKVLIASQEIYDPAAGSWTHTGPMLHSRIDCKATVLPNGRALISGGLDVISRDSIALTELYDPDSNLWFGSGDLNVSRYDHRATLLSDGKVLVSGGYHGVYPSGGHVAAGELYDPNTGIWTTTGSLSIARDGHTATLLTNGQVLVTGGTRFLSGGYTEVVNCDLYNPATGAWTPTGSLSARRSSHTATLLPDGRVMVTGGHYYQSGTFFRSLTEIYNPATGSWSASGSLNVARASHAATLLPNGKVLVTGGRQTISGTTLTSVELFDPITGTWTLTAPMSNARVYHTATLLLNGKVLAVGGSPDNGMSYHTATELYDVGLGFNALWQPQLSTITSPVALGANLALSGSGFRGVSEASCGSSQNSATDHPVLQLRRVDNEQMSFFNATAWTSNTFASTAIKGLPPGWAIGTIFVNGIPSAASSTLLFAHQLVVATANYTRAQGLGLRISISDLLTNVTTAPPDSISFTLTGVGPSLQGATLATNSSFILYSSTNNNNDSFPYRVSDGAGGTATGTVTVNVAKTVGQPLPSTRIVLNGNTATITAFGIPGFTYLLQSATNLAGPWWAVATNMASLSDGSLLFIDPNATNSQQYYRTAQP